MRIERINNESGFTLIEALTAMVILSVGIFSLYSMQINAVRGNSKASRTTTASTWNVDQIEKIIGMRYGDATIEADGTYDTDDGHYTVSWTVAEGMPIPNVKTIAVEVQDKNRLLSRPVAFTYIKPGIIEVIEE